jgi:catechol 2,3-dioxygenase-like lactoylglutathione lyase family enzyme
MEPGAFSISLAVKDLAASRTFYERRIKAQGTAFQVEADESTTGPASFIAADPDGNPVLPC